MALNENELLPGEVILLSKLANLWVRSSEYGLSEFAFAGLGGKEAVGGKAHLTNFRVLFAAHGSNRLTGTHSIFLPNIRGLRRGWTDITVATQAQHYQLRMRLTRR